MTRRIRVEGHGKEFADMKVFDDATGEEITDINMLSIVANSESGTTTCLLSLKAELKEAVVDAEIIEGVQPA